MFKKDYKLKQEMFCARKIVLNVIHDVDNTLKLMFQTKACFSFIWDGFSTLL